MKQHEGNSTSAGLRSLLAGLGAAAGSVTRSISSTQRHGVSAAYQHCVHESVAPQALFGFNPPPQVCCSKSGYKSTSLPYFTPVTLETRRRLFVAPSALQMQPSLSIIHQCAAVQGVQAFCVGNHQQKPRFKVNPGTVLTGCSSQAAAGHCCTSASFSTIILCPELVKRFLRLQSP